jgi:hypothetical protein
MAWRRVPGVAVLLRRPNLSKRGGLSAVPCRPPTTLTSRRPCTCPDAVALKEESSPDWRFRHTGQRWTGSRRSHHEHVFGENGIATLPLS